MKTAARVVAAMAAVVVLLAATVPHHRIVVRAKVLPQSRIEMLARGGVAVTLRANRRVRVRVGASLVDPAGASVALTRGKTVTLRAHRTRTVVLPLDGAGRSALVACPSARLAAAAVAPRGRRRYARTVGAPVRLDPPDCGRFFAATAVWNTPLSPGVPLDPDSASVTGTLVQEVRSRAGGVEPPTINTNAYTPPIYTVGADQARVAVKLDRPPGYNPALAAAFASVPVPPWARPSAGSDSEMVVWQPSTDTEWEFFAAHRALDGWHASWGGRIEHVSRDGGYFAAPHANWGATASSLSLAGGLITPRELATGEIDHALAIGVPMTRSRQWALPAQRSDGSSTNPHSVPEGARFRLDPSLDIASLHLTPPIAAIARAAQRYGLIVRDQSSAVVLYAQNTESLMGDPYLAAFGPAGPSALLETFPWSRLELVQMQLEGPGPPPPPPPLPCLVLRCG